MSFTPFLSIIVPIYNAEQYLEDCLNSIVCQNLTDYELLLVDDGSTDSSPAICDRYASSYSQIRVLHQQNQGLPGARQAGFAMATGEYIAFVDSDDRVDSRMYLAMCELARQYQADIIHCDFTAVMPTKEKICAVPYEPGFYDKKRLMESVYPNMIYSGQFFTFNAAPNIWNKLFRRELLAKHLCKVPLAIRNGEDFLVTYPCMLDAESIYFTNVPYYYYISRAESMCHTITRQQLEKVFLLFETIENTFDTIKYPFLQTQLDYYRVYQTLLYALPIMQELYPAPDGKKQIHKLFHEIIEKGYVSSSIKCINPRNLTGIRNKLFVYGAKTHFFPLILIAAKPQT